MKQTLIFTDFIENIEPNRYSVEMLATLNGHVLKFLSPYNAADITKEKKDQIFRVGLNTILSNAIAHQRLTDDTVPSPVNMAMLDKFGMFDIKQTVTFNNDLNKAGRDTSILLEGIW
ncbi:hypothetical protein OBP_195 [Pseudomonas phage OBP]|uniref:hypothetical protein n=1 Tax=Pseudomonas phage OBP TaxID=1124849 RepID=UPI000240D5A3|nr:hypothetical protein OBP_195 [Pseudomonas phage OBP]AEV89632.1 hypothetical protein OBP_195 [Pseudomonas phage OBP]